MPSKPVVFVVISLLVVALTYSSTSTFALKRDANSPSATCGLTGKQSENGLALVKCCWVEPVAPGTGAPSLGGNSEIYCSTCEDGGTRGKINCTDPELQFVPRKAIPPTTGGANAAGGSVLEQLPKHSLKDNAKVPKGGVLEQPQLTDQGTSGGSNGNNSK